MTAWRDVNYSLIKTQLTVDHIYTIINNNKSTPQEAKLELRQDFEKIHTVKSGSLSMNRKLRSVLAYQKLKSY